MAENRLNVTIKASIEGTGEVEQFNEAIGETEAIGRRSEKGLTELGGAFTHLGARAFIAYDRLSIASLAVENAQTRQMLAQDQLNFALDRYGAGSREAVRAQQQLEISTRGVEIAQTRFWVRMLFGVGIVIPDLIRGLKETIKILQNLHITNLLATTSTIGLTRAKLALIAATGIGIPLAIAGGLAAGVISPEIFGLGGAPTSPVNIYGNLNVAAQSPAEFGRTIAENQTIQNARGERY